MQLYLLNSLGVYDLMPSIGKRWIMKRLSCGHVQKEKLPNNTFDDPPFYFLFSIMGVHEPYCPHFNHVVVRSVPF